LDKSPQHLLNHYNAINLAACRQGLSRYSDSTGVEAIYPIELMAEQQLGKNWQKDFIKSVQIEKVLLRLTY
jgi:hypothetical protein